MKYLNGILDKKLGYCDNIFHKTIQDSLYCEKIPILDYIPPLDNINDTLENVIEKILTEKT